MSILNINAVKETATAPCCTSLYNAGASGVNWIHTNGKTLAASAGQTLKNVWSAVSAFFTVVAQKLGAFLSAAKDTLSAGFVKSKDAFLALPKEAKIAGAIGIVTTALATALCFKCFSKAETPAAPGATIAAAGATTPAQAQAAALANEAANVVANNNNNVAAGAAVRV